jgi:hypothetical protein
VRDSEPVAKPSNDSWPKVIRAALHKHRESAQLKKHYDDILMLVKEADQSKGIWTRLSRWIKRPCSVFYRTAPLWGLCFALDSMVIAEACGFSAPSFSDAFLAAHQDENGLKDEASVQQCLSTLRRQHKQAEQNGALFPRAHEATKDASLLRCSVWIAFLLCASPANAEYHWLVLSIASSPSIFALSLALTIRHQARKGSTVKCLATLGFGLLLTTPVFDSFVAVGSTLFEEHLLMRMTSFACGPQFANDANDLFQRVRSVLPAARMVTFLCSGIIVFHNVMLHHFEFPARKKILSFGGIAVAAVGTATACSASYHASEGDRNVIYMLLVLMSLNGVLLYLMPPRHEQLFTWCTTSHLALMVSYFAWFMGLTAVASVSMNYSLVTWLCRGFLGVVYLWAWLAPLVTIARVLKSLVIVEQPRMVRRRSF